MWSSIAIAIAAVTCGAIVRFVLDPVLASDAPLLVFILAVVAGAHYGGYGAAILTTVLAAITGTFFFLPPAFALHVPSAQEWLRIVIFVVEGVIIATVFHCLRRTEEQAKSSREDLARFVSFITHELRNPLSAITAATELLAQSGSHPRAGAIVQRQVAHLSTLLRDLSDELRVGRMALDVRPEYCDIEAVVKDAVDMAMPEISRCGQSFAHRFSTGPATVWGDPVRLRQVFANLLVNASRYTPDNGNIRLELARSGPHLIVDVADDGIGLSSDEIERIFLPFTRVAPDARGTGVGLAVAKTIVEQHGGTLTARSAGHGHGSTFTVVLPAERRTARDASSDARASEPLFPDRRRNVGNVTKPCELHNPQRTDKPVESRSSDGTPVAIARTGRDTAARGGLCATEGREESETKTAVRAH